jgi:excinuclease ABC subunit B
VRISLFDDEIESLTLFDPLTGHTRQKLGRFTVFPVQPLRHAARHGAARRSRRSRLELRERIEFFQKPTRSWSNASASSSAPASTWKCSTSWASARASRTTRATSPGARPASRRRRSIDYLPPDAIMFVDESHVTIPQVGGMYKGDRSRKENLVDYGFRLPSALDNRPLKFEEFEKLMPQTVFVSATPADYEEKHQGQVVEQVVRPTGLVDPVVDRAAGQHPGRRPAGRDQEAHRAGERVLVTTLTKRLAEQLTDYLADNGIKVRYLHSDIDTVERVEIIRDLRLGEFDVLVGINLLREGLDIPEVSLVAILDADKEGFLRSTRSLIQTMGRAARHLNGTAILYADRMTDSMRARWPRPRGAGPSSWRTTRRRASRRPASEAHQGHHRRRLRCRYRGARALKAAQEAARYEVMSEKDLAREIRSLEKAMQEHAKNLEFEEAAAARDELFRVKHLAFGGEAHDAPGMPPDAAPDTLRLHRQHLPFADGRRRGARPG